MSPADDELIGRWILDAEAIAERIATTLEGEEVGRRQLKMLRITAIDFEFLADGSFEWTTTMNFPEGARSALTRGRWERDGSEVKIAITEQEGRPFVVPREKLGRLEKGRVLFEDPLLNLILRRPA